jgi:hypothetical protein
MAIAFNAFSHSSSTGTSASSTHDSGAEADRFLIIGVMWQSNESIAGSAVTYDGVASTKIGEQSQTGGARRIALYYIEDPSSGSNTATATRGSSTGSMFIFVTSLSGADVFDVGGTEDVTEDPHTPALTTTADNDWMFGITRNGAGQTITAGTGTIRRSSTGGGDLAFGDSNGSVGSAGAHNLTWDVASSSAFISVTGSVKPVAVAAVVRNLMTLGVGR